MEVGGYAVPSGATLVCCPYLLHRRPEVYPEPDRFLPDRHAATLAVKGAGHTIPAPGTHRLASSERHLGAPAGAEAQHETALLVELEDWELVAGLESGLTRAGLLADGSVRYALAYALFKSGDYAATERHLAST